MDQLLDVVLDIQFIRIPALYMDKCLSSCKSGGLLGDQGQKKSAKYC